MIHVRKDNGSSGKDTKDGKKNNCIKFKDTSNDEL